MMTHRTTRHSAPLRTTFLAATLALVGVGHLGAQEDAPAETAAEVRSYRADTAQLKPRDRDNLAKLVADYYTARTESQGVLAATDALKKQLDSLAKREKVDSLLDLAADWELIMTAAKKYPANPQGKGRLRDRELTGYYGDTIEYWVHGPKGYKNSTPTPLVLIVPDKDQKTDDILRRDWLEQGTGIEDEMILVCMKMPSNLEDWTRLGSQGKPGGVDRVLQVLKDVSTEWNVDAERVFLLGVEDGVAAAVRVAGLFPDRFAGVIGRSGDPMSANVRNFSNLPVFLAAGSTNATAMANAAQEKGWTHIETPPSAELEDLIPWMRKQSRARYPANIQLEPYEQFASSAYWIKVEGFEESKSPWVNAVANRAENTITIEGEGISRVIVHFSDRILDLDRSVKVIIGGVVHEHVMDRSLELMLDRARNTGDPGRAYVAQRFYDFPIVAAPAPAK